MTTTNVVEITPGEIWEAKHGKHVGLRVQIIADRGNSVKVKVLRGYGANGPHKMAGSVWSIERSVFLTRYEQIELAVERPKVETDLTKLIAAMPPAPPITPAPMNGTTEISREERLRQSALKNFGGDAQAKRAATLQARMDALTPEQIEEIVRLFNEVHEPIGEIARAYKLGVDHINRILTQHTQRDVAIAKVTGVSKEDPRAERTKLTIEHQFSALSPETKAEICKRRSDGETYWTLMREYGLINGALKRVLDEGGVPGGHERQRQDYQRKKVALKQKRDEVRARVLAERAMNHPLVKEAMASVKLDGATQTVESPTPVAPDNFSPARYYAKVWVTEPVLKEIPIDAADFDEAIRLAYAVPHSTRVVAVWEAGS